MHSQLLHYTWYAVEVGYWGAREMCVPPTKSRQMPEFVPLPHAPCLFCREGIKEVMPLKKAREEKIPVV